MELFNKAKQSDNFGLRKHYYWSGNMTQAPWTTGRISRREKSYIYSFLEDLEDWEYWEDLTIKRIQNPYLWGRYVLRYEEMRADSVSRDVYEDVVIHATSIDNAYQIADQNYNWRLVKRYRYGRGVSFARDADYADGQATLNDAFIITGILVANTEYGHYGTRIPSGYSDTTLNRQESVLVKYNDNEYYPYYIVY